MVDKKKGRIHNVKHQKKVEWVLIYSSQSKQQVRFQSLEYPPPHHHHHKIKIQTQIQQVPVWSTSEAHCIGSKEPIASDAKLYFVRLCRISFTLPELPERAFVGKRSSCPFREIIAP